MWLRSYFHVKSVFAEGDWVNLPAYEAGPPAGRWPNWSYRAKTLSPSRAAAIARLRFGLSDLTNRPLNRAPSSSRQPAPRGQSASGSRLGASLEDWPDDDAGEVAPSHQPGAGQPGASSSAAPDAQGGAKKRRAALSLFGSRPKKPKGSSAATQRDEAAAKAIRFRKTVKEPAPLSLEKSAAASIVGSVETSTTTRRIDPAADLREVRQRNAQEAREEQEAARVEKAEAEKAEATALKKLVKAEAADAAKKQAEEAAHRQSAIFITPLNSAPPPPKFVAQTGEAGDEHPV
nr:translation initiation factor IF-2-like [Aegilops tauschii subsp. strangulata]